MSSCCLSMHKLEAVINNATIADSCLQLDRKLETASNCSKSSCCLYIRRPKAALSNNTNDDICLWLDKKLKTSSNCSISFD